MQLPPLLYRNKLDSEGRRLCWDGAAVRDLIGAAASIRTIERSLSAFLPETLKVESVLDHAGRGLNPLVRDDLEAEARSKRLPSLAIQWHKSEHGQVLMANDGRGGRRWFWVEGADLGDEVRAFLDALSRHYEKQLLIWPVGEVCPILSSLKDEQGTHDLALPSGGVARLALTAYQAPAAQLASITTPKEINQTMDMTHLDRLEAESIHIIREVMAEAEKPVMLYSIGKDSSVMLRLAEKAFYPSQPPFPLLHVDTRWKFRAMYEFRARIAEETGMEMLVHINPEGEEKNINPFDHGSALHTDVMKTQGLIQALDAHGFDAAFGGARRDEEKSRAKERVFSFRNSAHRWDPKNQRPELWNLYNGRKAPGESIRVFPLSNWTELDIWQYIYKEDIPIVPLYFAAERPVIEREGMLMLVDDERLKLFPGEKIQTKRVRFRTLGCYPLTGAIESEADSLPKILLELMEARTSERQGRAIDTDSAGSMEKKKQDGYF